MHPLAPRQLNSEIIFGIPWDFYLKNVDAYIKTLPHRGLISIFPRWPPTALAERLNAIKEQLMDRFEWSWYQFNGFLWCMGINFSNPTMVHAWKVGNRVFAGSSPLLAFKIQRNKMILLRTLVKIQYSGGLRDREVKCSASDRQGSNLKSCVWRAMPCHSSSGSYHGPV